MHYNETVKYEEQRALLHNSSEDEIDKTTSENNLAIQQLLSEHIL